MTTLVLRSPVALGPATSTFELVDLHIQYSEKRVFIRYSIRGTDGELKRGAPYEQLEVLEDVPIPAAPPQDDDPAADARAQGIWRQNRDKAARLQLFTKFVDDTLPLVERAHKYFCERRALERA